VEPLRVGEIVAPPGQQASGYVTVPDGVDPGTKIPVTVIQGSRPGPVLALVAGTHGSEYTSIVALHRRGRQEAGADFRPRPHRDRPRATPR